MLISVLWLFFWGVLSGGYGHPKEADESVLHDVSAVSHQRQHDGQRAGKAVFKCGPPCFMLLVQVVSCLSCLVQTTPCENTAQRSF